MSRLRQTPRNIFGGTWDIAEIAYRQANDELVLRQNLTAG